MSENDDEWRCPDCGARDPHHALMLNEALEMDVTCGGIYFTFPNKPIDGFYLTQEEFEIAMKHYDRRPEFE